MLYAARVNLARSNGQSARLSFRRLVLSIVSTCVVAHTLFVKPSHCTMFVFFRCHEIILFQFSVIFVAQADDTL